MLVPAISTHRNSHVFIVITWKKKKIIPTPQCYEKSRGFLSYNFFGVLNRRENCVAVTSVLWVVDL